MEIRVACQPAEERGIIAIYCLAKAMDLAKAVYSETSRFRRARRLDFSRRCAELPFLFPATLPKATEGSMMGTFASF